MLRQQHHQQPSVVSQKRVCPYNPNIFPDYMFAAAETTDKPTPRDELTTSDMTQPDPNQLRH